jgi:hypothetical protein
MVKNSQNFTMALIQCEMQLPTVKSPFLKFNFFFFGFKKKISVLEVKIGKNGPGILGVNENSNSNSLSGQTCLSKLTQKSTICIFLWTSTMIGHLTNYGQNAYFWTFWPFSYGGKFRNDTKPVSVGC